MAATTKKVECIPISSMSGYASGKGDRVTVLSYNNPEMLAIQFACTRLGAIFVPLNFRLTVPELEYIVSDCAAKVMFADVEFAETAQKVAKLAAVEEVILTNSDGSDSPYEQAMAASNPRSQSIELMLDDPLTIEVRIVDRIKDIWISGGENVYSAEVLPQSVEFTDALPRNATGKVLKTKLREQLGDGSN